jgi:hypothetical protein
MLVLPRTAKMTIKGSKSEARGLGEEVPYLRHFGRDDEELLHRGGLKVRTK